MNDRDPAAKATEHLSELEADVAAAEDDQMFGNCLKLHDGFVREVADAIDPREARRIGTSAGVNKNLIAFDRFGADLYLVRRQEPSDAAVQADFRMIVDSVLLAVAKMLNHGILARDNRGKIDCHAGGVDAPLLRVARVMRHLCRSDHRLRGRAAGVDACAAEMGSLDQSNGQAALGDRGRKRISRLPGADDDGVVFHW